MSRLVAAVPNANATTVLWFEDGTHRVVPTPIRLTDEPLAPIADQPEQKVRWCSYMVWNCPESCGLVHAQQVEHCSKCGSAPPPFAVSDPF